MLKETLKQIEEEFNIELERYTRTVILHSVKNPSRQEVSSNVNILKDCFENSNKKVIEAVIEMIEKYDRPHIKLINYQDMREEDIIHIVSNSIRTDIINQLKAELEDK
jgi:hypothetical protein